jgi:hypothetical protein
LQGESVVQTSLGTHYWQRNSRVPYIKTTNDLWRVTRALQ